MSERNSAPPANPFRGTLSFGTGDKLFGRDQEVVSLTSQVLARRVVLLHSPSGAGKTSLVQAGLLSVLNRRGFHILPKLRVNEVPPLGSLPAGQGCSRYLYSILRSLDMGQGISDDRHLSELETAELSLNPSGLTDYLESHAPFAAKTLPKRRPGRASGSVRSLLFFDQFEEVLSLDPLDLKTKKELFVCLAPLLSDERYYVIFAMREEFVAGLEPYVLYFPERLTSRFRLELLDQAAALQAIRKPVQRVQVEFEADAARDLVVELSQITIREAAQTQKKPGLYVEPSQLQVVCGDLFDLRTDLREITKDDVRGFLPIDNALGAYYARKVRDIANDDTALERKLREWIENELIINQSLRGQALTGEEQKFGLNQQIIEKLIKAYLVRVEPRRNLAWYELTHDTWVRPVISSNAAWRELHASQFEIMVARWSKAPEADRTLPAGEALRQAVAWGEEHFDGLTEAQKQFLSVARRELQRLEVRRDNRAELGVNLEDTGWGVIFAANAPAAMRDSLKELLDHRRKQAVPKRESYYREFTGANGYRPGETAQRFLARFDAGSGPANPEKMPYYLLIVGDPAEIPFEFQYALDTQYAVGRIYFETLEEYARYARSVVLSEIEHAEGRFNLPKQLTVFATEHPTGATQLSMNLLARPLLAELPEKAPNWYVDHRLGEAATKAHLAKILDGPQAPAVLFTLTHAIAYNLEDKNQRTRQGALVCQDWKSERPSPDQSYSGDDVTGQGNLLGTIIFTFGDYTAGTSEFDSFPDFGMKQPRRLAARTFLAQLPQKLLSHPKGGALAVIAHVDRAWTHSFVTQGEKTTSDIGVFRKTFLRLMQGQTAGSAMTDFNQRYAFYSSLLADELNKVVFYNAKREDYKLQQMLTQTIDARNYILIGDPAVRLPVHADQPDQEAQPGWQRPTIGEIKIAPAEAEEPALPTISIPPEKVPEGVTLGVHGDVARQSLLQMNVDNIAAALLRGTKIGKTDK